MSTAESVPNRDIVARHVTERKVLAAIVEEVAAMRGPALRALPPGQ